MLLGLFTSYKWGFSAAFTMRHPGSAGPWCTLLCQDLLGSKARLFACCWKMTAALVISGLLVVCLNPLVITWQTWQIQTESTVQITLFGGSRFCALLQIWPSVSWWSQLTLFFSHACHFHIPWKVVKSYQVAHAFQFMEDWSHLLPGTMGVPSTIFNCRHGLTWSFMSSTKFYVIWPLNYY